MGRIPAGAPNELARAIAGAIDHERERAGVSTPDLIKRSGLSANYFYKRVRLETPFTVNDLQTIADALGISARVFLEPALAAYEQVRDATGSRPSAEVLAKRVRRVITVWEANHPGRDVKTAVAAGVDAHAERMNARQWAQFVEGDASSLTDGQLAAVATYFGVTPAYFRRAELRAVEDDLDAQIDVQLALAETGALDPVVRPLGSGDPGELRAIAAAIRTAASHGGGQK